MTDKCATCRFFYGDQCRRRSPRHRDANEFALIAMLQAIAQALLKQAKLFSHAPGDKWDATEPYIDAGYIDSDVWTETTEQYQPQPWPRVDEDDWCGEWEGKPA